MHEHYLKMMMNPLKHHTHGEPITCGAFDQRVRQSARKCLG